MAGVPAGRLSIEIVAEIARLQADLDKAKKLVNAASGDIAKSASAANDNIGRIGGTSKLASHQVTNLAYQFQDLGVQFAGAAASGKPLQGVMMALIQQGPQIGMIMREAGIGAKGLATELGGMVSRFASAHPYLVAFAAVAAAAAAAMKLFTVEINGDRRAELDAYANSLGLTAEEMEKLGPLTITVSDLISGLGKTFSDEFGINMPNLLDGFKSKFFDAFNAYMAISRTVTSAIYAGFVGTFNGVKTTWSMLPAVLGDAAYGAANKVIDALNWILRKGTEYTNKFIGMIKSVTSMIPGFDGQAIDPLKGFEIGNIANPYAGAGRTAANAFMGEYSKAFNEAEATQKRIGQAIADNTVQAAKDRYAGQANELIDDRTTKKLKDKAGKAGKDAGKEAADKFKEWWDKTLTTWRIDLITDVMKQVAANEKEAQEGLDRLTRAAIEQRIYETARATEALNEQVDALISSLENIKGFGGILGDIAGVLTSTNPIGSLLGMGGLGSLLGNVMGGQEPWDKLAVSFETTLRDTFKLGGNFSETLGKTLSNVMQGASIGSAVGAVAFNSKNEQIGAQIGGVLGNVAGKAIGKSLGSALGSLGKAAGPLGAIAGSLLGGVLGGLLNSNRTAGAVVTSSGVTVGGKDKGNYGAATDLGSAVQDGLAKIAESLGATMGDFMVAIGMRGDQIRVNTTGTSLKFDQGAVGFGQDAEKAVMFAIAAAIKQGALQGLSAGIEKLISGNGDLEAQLQKALSFQAVFDELAQLKDPQGVALEGLEAWKKNLDAIFVEAGATGEQLAQLEELYGIKRAEIVEQYGQEVIQNEEQKRQLEIQIMELQGKTAEALAASRALELEGMDAALRPLQERIYALQDEAVETERARVRAQERAGLEVQLLDLQGDTVALRAREREAIDPLNRDLYDLIKAMEDWQEAVQKSKSLFDAQTSIEQEILGLRAQLATGDEKAALQALQLKLAREAELRAADATLRPLLLVKYGLEDLVTASNAVAEAAANAKAEADRIAGERYGLETQWLELIGDQATLRARELEKLDPSNRKLQQDIWDLQDAQAAAAEAAEAAAKAEQERAAAIEQARNVIAQAYDREASSKEGFIERMRSLATEIAGFRRGLFNTDNSGRSFAQAQSTYRNTALMAGLGNESSLQSFTGDAQAYLDAALNSVGSYREYQKILAEVNRGALTAEKAANGMADKEQQQLDALTELVSQYVDLNENVVTVADAVASLEALTRETTTPQITDTLNTGMTTMTAAIDRQTTVVSEDGKNRTAAEIAMNGRLLKIETMLSRVIRNDKMIVGTDGAIEVTVSDPVTIGNTTDNPVPTQEVV